MHIKDLFTKNLFRPINGVVKADQQDEAVVWQELDEYVVTRELDKHFRKFFEAYLALIDNPRDKAITDCMGVWVSGFFGSGKSHFIKILSYLLKNKPARNPANSEKRNPVDFFDTKINDSMLLADIKRAVGFSTDVILFNIDSKADSKEGRDAILSVFIRVFNEMQGFSGDAPHIAGMERYLQGKELLNDFHSNFKNISGDEWTKERDAYLLKRDEVIKALSKTLNMSDNSAAKWFDEADNKFKLNIEGFAKLVKDYLDSKGPDYRIVFLIDEVGQFIGADTHLMLSLQTMIEDLGRICNGRAWVIVTSQEDIDAVLGEIGGTKANDFSKIQGRFNTRISLSSANTDEVIQSRLLEKTGDAQRALQDLYQEKGEILKNQISFTQGATLKNYKDKDDFVKNYPFAPYQFLLLQKVFESIRKAGATGKHLAMGERSMLDAFQAASKNIADKSIGAMVPLYEFYPAIESFLDTIVKRTIDQAKDNPGLEPFDGQLLRTLFLIRYVDVIKPNIDNLVTLSIDEVDADRFSIKRRIEESLQRLEKETLVSRNGDLYFFVTNEERDIRRRIKGVEIAGSDETKLLSEIIFDEVLKGDNKHKYLANRKDYSFNRFCDGQVFGRVDSDLTVEVITPLNDDFSSYNPAKCIGQSASDAGRALIKLSDNAELGKELRTFLQSNKFIRIENTDTAPAETKSVLQKIAEENRERKNRLVVLLNTLMVEADYYALGQSLQQTSTSSRAAIGSAVNYLIQNIYTKLGYLNVLQEEHQKEIRAVLLSDEIGQGALTLDGTEGNAQALKEVKQFIDLSVGQSHRIPIDELVKRFSGRPYGWSEWEIILLIARLFMAGEIKLMTEGAAIQPREAIEPLTKSVKWKMVTILKRKTVGAQELTASRKLGQDLFGQIGSDTEDKLYIFLRENLIDWDRRLSGYKTLADTGSYPGKKEINSGCTLLEKLLSIRDSYEFFQAFNQAKDDIKDLCDDMHELDDFYTNQRTIWERLKKAMEGVFRLNRQELGKDDTARQSLVKMDQILSAPKPYGMLKEVDTLIASVKKVNDVLVEKRREYAMEEVDKFISQISQALGEYKATPDLRNKALKPIQDIKKQLQQEESIPGMFYQQNMAKEQLETAIELIENEAGKKPKAGTAPKPVKFIKPAIIAPKNYIETEEDIEEFLKALKQELLEALKKNSRIRIQ
jgi:hypothetical protein